METKGNLLLVIDAQNDFCQPTGALYVEGAEKDIKNLSRFIQNHGANIDDIVLTQDVHHILDISHPGFWIDKNGEHPEAFTMISFKDINTGVWKPRFNVIEAAGYVKKLEQQGEYPHIIWPEHCLVGSHGAAIAEEVMLALVNWARQGNYFEVFQKGLNPLTEHFGALRANIPIEKDTNTLINRALKSKLINAQQIIVSGEAKSHCVANTIKQICEIEGLIEKTILLEDTCSNVRGFEELAVPIYEKAVSLGLSFSNTIDIKF
jgi:nicotinamidase/pyrazinamidase